MTTKIHNLHPWRLSAAQAKAVQAEMRERVELRPLALRGIRHVAGSV